MRLRQKLYFTAALVILVIFLGAMSMREQEKNKMLVFPESLEKVVAVVDDEELKLKDMAFYIAYQEGKIEEEARIYNPDNPDEYWWVRTNHTFVRSEGKTLALEMAIHDEIFYRMAVAEGVELTEEEEAHLANDQYDFWSDLEDGQKETLGVEKEVIDESMRKIAIAEKYQYLWAEMNGDSYEEYALSGQEYEDLVKTHVCQIEETVWDKVDFGGITVDH